MDSKDRTKTEVYEELDSLASRITQIKIRGLQSDVVQQQNIASEFILVLERFHEDLTHGEVEILDSGKTTAFELKGNKYRYLTERPLHRHNYVELMVVLSGSVRNRIGDESYICREGQGCLMNGQILHKEEPCGDATVLFVGMSRAFIRSLMTVMDSEGSALGNRDFRRFLEKTADSEESFTREYWDFSPLIPLENLSREVFLLGEAAFDAVRRQRPGNSSLLKAAVLHFFDRLCDPSVYTLQSVSSSLNHHAFLASRIDFLIRASNGRISKKELGEYLSYNGDYLGRIYKQERDRAITDACCDAMIAEAQRLLGDTDLSVDEIMDRLGLSGRGYFYTAFRNKTGMTPKAYRTSMRQN